MQDILTRPLPPLATTAALAPAVTTFEVVASSRAGVLGTSPAYVTASGVEAFACCHAITAHG